MRILIYIEPYPLRNEMDHHRDIAIAFADMLVKGVEHPEFQDHDIRLYGNRETLNRVQETSFAGKRFLLWPEREEMDLFRGGLTDWTTGGIEGWQQLLRGEGEITEAYVEILKGLRERFPFDMVLHWGENGAVRAFAKETGCISVLASPGGLRASQKDCVYLDAGGSGAEALLAQVPLKALLKATEDHCWPSSAEISAFTGEQPLETVETLYGPVNFSGSEHVLTRGDKRAAFVPLPVHDDPDFLAHSGFSSPAEFLKDVVLPLARRGVICLVRPERPCWDALGGDSAMREAQSVISSYRDRILWIDPRAEPVSAQQLLTLTDVTVATSGHAAFQAMLFDKPVCLIGNAYFKTETVFYRPDDIIRRRLSRKGYPPAIKALRAFLLRAHLIDRPSLFVFENFIQRLSDIAANVERLDEKPAEVLKELLETYAPSNPAQLIRDRKPVSERHAQAPGTQDIEARDENRKPSLLGKIIRKAKAPLRGRAKAGDQSPREETCAPDKAETARRFPLSDDERNTIERAKNILRSRTRFRRKIAVILHGFYDDIALDLLEPLKRIPVPFDLVVTVPEFASDQLEQEILTRRPSAVVVPLPNRGQHVWPFLFVLQELGLDAYETVLKIQTAKHMGVDGQPQDEAGSERLERAIASLLGRIDTTEHVSGILEARESWSIAGPLDLFGRPGHATDCAAEILRAGGLEPPVTWSSFTGAMFWANPEVFEPLLPDLADPERYAPPYAAFPNEFTQTAELLLTTAATYSDAPAATLEPEDSEPRIVSGSDSKTGEDATLVAR